VEPTNRRKLDRIIRLTMDAQPDPMPQEQQQALFALLPAHPQVKHFESECILSIAMPARGRFRVTTNDGAFTIRSSRIESETPRSRLMDALRVAVLPQTHAFRLAAPSIITCPILHTPFKLEECDVDHAPPWTFATIVDVFLERLDASPEKLDVSVFGWDPEYDRPIAPPALATVFADYHQQRATLRMMSSFANRRIQYDE
jgi:hypothetical protein